MALTTPAEVGLHALEAQVRECYGRVVYSHKAHEKSADIFRTQLTRIKLAQIILSAIVTGGLLTVLIGPQNTSRPAAAVSAILSTVLLALNAYMKNLDPGQRAEKHKETATQLWSVRESYLSMITDIRSGVVSSSEGRERRDVLQARLETIYASAPRTLDAAYAKAGIALKQDEELTFSEAEIDKFLPPALRRTSST